MKLFNTSNRTVDGFHKTQQVSKPKNLNRQQQPVPPIVFIAFIASFSSLFLVGSLIAFNFISEKPPKGVELLLSEAGNIVDFKIETNNSTPVFSLIPVASPKTIFYNIDYTTEIINEKDFIKEINAFVASVRKSGGTRIDLNASNGRFSFLYEGPVGAEANAEQLNAALFTLQSFARTDRIHSLEIATLVTKGNTRPLIKITTQHSLGYSLGSNIEMVNYLPGVITPFDSEEWFTKYDFEVNVHIETDYLTGVPIVISSVFSSMEQVEAAKIINPSIYYNLAELAHLPWVTVPESISFTLGFPFETSNLLIVVDSTDSNESLRVQMESYWMRGNPIFRPQSYLVSVVYSSPDGEQLFGLGR